MPTHDVAAYCRKARPLRRLGNTAPPAGRIEDHALERLDREQPFGNPFRFDVMIVLVAVEDVAIAFPQRAA